jgi:hypothetical protein
MDTLAGAKWFSTLDLKSGYWKADLHPDDKETTAFWTGQGLWQFTVVVFRNCNAPAKLERLKQTSCETSLTSHVSCTWMT